MWRGWGGDEDGGDCGGERRTGVSLRVWVFTATLGGGCGGRHSNHDGRTIKNDGWVDEGAGGEGTLVVRGGCGNVGEGRCCKRGNPEPELGE